MKKLDSYFANFLSLDYLLTASVFFPARPASIHLSVRVGVFERADFSQAAVGNFAAASELESGSGNHSSFVLRKGSVQGGSYLSFAQEQAKKQYRRREGGGRKGGIYTMDIYD